jgi:hypothetical protein
MDAKTDRQTDRQTDGRMDGRTDILCWVDEQMNRHRMTNGYNDIHRQTEIQRETIPDVH